MSTKTTFKRIALVAVAALGFGMISNVPANAAAIAPTSIVVGTIPTAQVGVATTVPVTVTLPLTATTADTFTLVARVTSSPTGSAFRSVAALDTLKTGVIASGSTVAASINITAPATNTGALTTAVAMASGVSVGANFSPSNAQVAAAAVAGVFNVVLNVVVTPDFAGSYSVLVSTNGDANSTPDSDSDYSAGDANTTFSFTTGGSASTVTLAAVTGSGIAGASQGVLFSATIKDAAGGVAQLGVNETITLSSPSTTETMVGVNPTNNANIGSAAATYVATSANFTNGVAYFRWTNSAAETAVITATGSGLLPATVLGTLSITTRTASSVAATGVFTDSTAQAAAIAAGTGGRTAVTGTYSQSVSRTATSHSYTVTFGTPATLAGDYVSAVVTDTSGRITGIVGGTYAVALTTAAVGTATTGGTAPVSITATLATAGNSFSVAVAGATLTVTSATSAVTTLSAISPSATTIRQADGASTAMTVRVLDQFGAAMASQVVTVATAGRNASTTATTVVSDASGYVSFTRADAGTAATVLKADTVTFTFTPTTGSAVTRAYTVNYGSTAVGTITCTSGAELDTATSVTYRDISSADGAEAGAASLCTVTVRDANGAIMVGVPVTVTTASAGAAVVSTSATLYTGAAGTVAPQVYAWTAGAKTFTVTAGSVTSTETVNYRQADAAEVRTIAVRADGNRHYVTASDRFGNPVPGVRIYGSRTGSGLFGGGSPTANGITGSPAVVDANYGVAEFIFNGGSTESVVTYQVASAADTPSATFGQTDALKGLTDGTTATSTFTASRAGTALLAEEGVGASFDAAGVNLVRATIAPDTAAADAVSAAADAAAEATDAANAATDAANAAAEAADAATAAAQDAADAVAALSTQVTELVSALRKQITSLTNLVIKIQKKVRA
jgi:trimeric autotransporter adhesin